MPPAGINRFPPAPSVAFVDVRFVTVRFPGPAIEVLLPKTRPSINTSAEIIAPLVRIRAVSAGCGTPEGVQLFGSNQSVEMAPVQSFSAAREQKDVPRSIVPITKTM